MPRTPEVCPPLFCPLSYFSNIACRVLGILPHALRHQASACGHLRSDFYRLPFAVLLLRCAFCLLVITCNSSLDAALAQGTTATLSGTVTDQNGAVIPDVSIAVINIAQGFQRSTTTSGEGAFVVPLLPPGHYTVKAEHNGFTPTEVRDVVLNVNDQVAMKIHMNVGTVSQTVQIVEGSSLINESPAVGTVVDRQFVANLPLNGRSFQSLITLTPGVVLSKTDVNNQGQFSVNGQRADANYFTVDGVSANVGVSSSIGLGQSASGSLPGLSVSGGTNNLVSVDALQEFRIQTSTFAPEFGRTPGAQISIVTRSGTNQVRGSLFEYFRNDVLDANDWFANANRLPKSALRQNDFGGVIGGPIIKNRTFFFFSYEGLRLRQPQTALTTVPSIVARRTAPAQMQPLLNAFPVPNGEELGGGVAEFSASFSSPTSLNATSIRIDHTVSDNLRLFGRYNFAPSRVDQRDGSVVALSTVTTTRSTTQTLTGGATLVITPTVNNDFRVNWSRTREASSALLDGFGGAIPPPESLLFPSSTSRQDSFYALFIFNLTGRSLQMGKIANSIQRQVNLVNNLSLVAGAHQMTFGIDYRRLSPVFGIRKYFQFPVFFNVEQAVSGVLPFGLVRSNQSNPTFVFTNFSAFGQDNWKVTPRLTLTYGLRWEVNPPPSETTGNAPFAVNGADSLATLSLEPRGTPLYKTSYNNFAPRVGLAYQLSQKQGREIVLRGGFGIFYDLGTQQAGSVLTEGNLPYSATRNLFGVSYPLDPTLAAPPTLNLNPPFAFFVAFDPSLKLPRTYQWNTALEQSLGANQTVSASYVAAVGRRLQRRERLTRAAGLNSTFTSLDLIKDNATSDYHALQIQFQRRLSKGLQTLASYTWSHSIDDTSSGTLDVGRARGASDFDVRHAFSAAITYNLPTPSVGAVAKSLLRNWSIDTILTARSATPVNITALTFVTVGGVPQDIRPDLVLGIPLYINDRSAPGGRRINKAAFTTPQAGRQGTLGRNALRGFSLWQIDLALRRQLNLTERVNLQFRAEAFNLLNHPNFGDPINDLSQGLFGQSTRMLGRSLGSGGVSGGFNPLYQVGGPRSVQFALKLSF